MISAPLLKGYDYLDPARARPQKLLKSLFVESTFCRVSHHSGGSLCPFCVSYAPLKPVLLASPFWTSFEHIATLTK